MTHCQGTGFIESDDVDPMGEFQGLCILDQNAIFGGHARTGHDRRWRCQTECAGAGNHQHRHGMDQSLLKGMARQPPSAQRQGCQHHNHRDKHAADPIDQALNRCLGSLRILHQPDDARQHGFLTDSGDPHHDPTIPVDGASGQRGIRRLVDWQGFAGEHGLINLGLPLQQ